MFIYDSDGNLQGVVKHIALWKPADLNCILQKGDEIFKNVRELLV